MDRAPRWLRARNTFHELSLDAVDAYLNNVATIPDHLRFGLYTDKFKSELQGYHPRALFRDLMARAPSDEPLMQAQYADMKTWLSGRMLVKVDRASMANGLEVRNPLLDHDLVQWALTLPDTLKCHGGEYKIALKKSAEPLLPPGFLTRPKQGFSIPLREWLAGPLRSLAQTALTSSHLLDSGWFDRGALDRLLREHTNGDRDHAAPIWSLMILERFLARQAA
jgi:asparagine synthase (glutamine-hydrolysing)